MLQTQQKPLDRVLEFAIDDALLVRRVVGRLVHAASGRTYHEEFKPPRVPMKDDVRRFMFFASLGNASWGVSHWKQVTGEPLERRADDTASTLQRRLDVYHKQTQPLVAYYSKKHLLTTIDASQPSDAVWANIRAIFARVVKKQA